MTGKHDPSAASTSAGRLTTVLSLTQKLAAVEAGTPGSYNFAPALGQEADPIFQGLANQAFEIARARGYFHRESPKDGGPITGLLVNVPATAYAADRGEVNP